MHHKRFYVKIVLQLHAITCPGVWLCTHGYLEATIKTLGYYFRTGAMEPRFPLLCHDQFTMEGYFKSVGSMDELERVLAAEQVEVTLWQNGRRLAYFLGKLSDVMHPTVPKLTCEHNVNVQLLMKATPAFPGIIAPKVELTAQVGVQDRLRRGSNASSSGRAGSAADSSCSKYINAKLDLDATRKTNRHAISALNQPKEEQASCFSYLEERRRQQPVCHTKNGCGVGNGCAQHACSIVPSAEMRRKSIDGLSDAAVSFQKHSERRRLSTCSSHFSSNSYNSSAISRSPSSCDCLSQCTQPSGSAADDHQERCAICQSYKKAFMFT